MWERAELLLLPYYKRPTVRVQVDGGTVQEGAIVPEHAKVWIVFKEDGRGREETVSWTLLLAVLNDPRQAPISFHAKGESCGSAHSRP